MNGTKEKTTLDFNKIRLSDKPIYEKHLANSGIRGCEYSFANLYLWGRQTIAELDSGIAFFSQFDRRSVYPFPLAEDKKAALDAIIADSQARGIPCRITGVRPDDRKVIETLYPDRFRFHCDEGSFDYVYDINDLADLAGKKYHAKRNHLNRFKEEFPDYTVEPITEENKHLAIRLVNDWYDTRTAESPNVDFHMERAALDKAFRDFEALEMYGLMLVYNGEALAMTFGSKLSKDTLDVHFEKAKLGINGAYAAINYEFARYIREKLSDIKYLDREEDMGLEGLRKAKRSYYPHHMIEKCWACLLEDGYDY